MAGFPDSLFCRNHYPTFGSVCEVPNEVAYSLVLTTVALIAIALLVVASRINARDR